MLWVSYPGGERGINYVDPLKGMLQSKANRFARMRFILVPISNLFGWVPMKKPNTECWALLWRRERDSNPRRCDPQRFSRPPHSTTLPSLLMGGKYNMIFPLKEKATNKIRSLFMKFSNRRFTSLLRNRHLLPNQYLNHPKKH